MLGLSAMTCFILSVAVFAVVYIVAPRKFSWFPFLLVTFLFSLIAFNIMPAQNDDLSRYFKAINEMREGGYDELQRYIDEDQFDFKNFRVAAYYIYFFSKLDNNSWLPAVTIFIVYGLGFYVLYKAANRFGINKTNLFFASMFFISTYWYYDVASGIRNGLAFAVAFACAYQHMAERKHIPLCILGYFLASLTHSSGILPVVLVFIAFFALNVGGKFIDFLLIFGLAGGNLIIQFLAKRTDNSFIQSLAGKAEHHSGGVSLETGTMFLVNISVLAVCLLLLMYFSHYIFNSNFGNELNRLYKYLSVIIYFSLGATLSGLIFVRFARWILPLAGGLIFMIGMQLQGSQIEKRKKAHLSYYSISDENFSIKLRTIVMIAFIVFTAVHFWYLCNGSSLLWLNFESDL
ncbi:MAG: EpsG family protein [Acetobacter sp.]|nr:EpsG family protein [Bacteroides sp.]MCM1341565.1 EpsG family protein [Acetobacter sp.]MCM1433642.1 EpsG family protein [Clostridiales bacterium]